MGAITRLLIQVICLSLSDVGADDGYIGCYRDRGERAMEGPTISHQHITTETCRSYCLLQGYLYFGTQYRSHCFCGNSYDKYGTADNCNMACQGDKSQTCGGGWANSIYRTRCPHHNQSESAVQETNGLELEVKSLTNYSADIHLVSITDHPQLPFHFLAVTSQHFLHITPAGAAQVLAGDPSTCAGCLITDRSLTDYSFQQLVQVFSPDTSGLSSSSQQLGLRDDSVLLVDSGNHCLLRYDLESGDLQVFLGVCSQPGQISADGVTTTLSDVLLTNPTGVQQVSCSQGVSFLVVVAYPRVVVVDIWENAFFAKQFSFHTQRILFSAGDSQMLSTVQVASDYCYITVSEPGVSLTSHTISCSHGGYTEISGNLLSVEGGKIRLTYLHEPQISAVYESSCAGNAEPCIKNVDFELITSSSKNSILAVTRQSQVIRLGVQETRSTRGRVRLTRVGDADECGAEWLSKTKSSLQTCAYACVKRTDCVAVGYNEVLAECALFGGAASLANSGERSLQCFYVLAAIII